MKKKKSGLAVGATSAMKKRNAEHNAATDSSPSTSAAAASVRSDVDLKALIHEHSVFFDRLVELIPARFYLPVDDKERPWFQGLSKAAKASAKKESRENRKKARRERLDPEKSATTLDLLKKNIEAAKEENNPESQADGAGGERKDIKGTAPGNRAVTFEELQQRLRRRIEELRAKRNADNPAISKHEKEEDKKRRKRKRDEKSEGGEDELKPKEAEKGEEQKHRNASSVEFSFGHVKLGEGDERGRKKKRLPKEKALKKAEELKEAMKDPDKGAIVQKKHSWSAAVSRAIGEKVHDDPRLIKESMKKEKKRREKASSKWKERVATTRKKMGDRQKKRADNISGKIHEKKMKKIEKREKKLMRPGKAPVAS